MLVIISDLHLTDGTSGHTIRKAAFRALRQRLSDLAYDASWRDENTYKPIEQLDVILLGDILDVIRSTAWLGGIDGPDPEVRPWDDVNSDTFQKMVSAITDQILAVHKDSISVIKDLSKEGAITIPKTGGKSKPVADAIDPESGRRQPVTVRVHYMIGNHDWFYGIEGRFYNDVRKRIVKAMGLANDPAVPFPHDPYETEPRRIKGTKQPGLLELMRAHEVFARHGDIYDPINFVGDRKSSSLGDVIVVELLCRFGLEVRRQLGDQLPKDCLDGLRELDNVRPLQQIPAWIKGLLIRTCPDKSTAKAVERIWDQVAKEFNDVSWIKEHDTWKPFETVDLIQAGLTITRFASLAKASDIGMAIHDKKGSYAAHAMQESDFKSRRARFIVYGHTHHHEIVPLDESPSGSGMFSQFYINSGTWRRVHQLARLDEKSLEFLQYNVVTYLAFFEGDERGGRRFESWNGAMGVGPDDDRWEQP